MAVVVGGWVEAAGQEVLGFGGEAGLVLEHDDVRVVEGIADDSEVIISEVFDIDVFISTPKSTAEVEGTSIGRTSSVWTAILCN